MLGIERLMQEFFLSQLLMNLLAELDAAKSEPAKGEGHWRPLAESLSTLHLPDAPLPLPNPHSDPGSDIGLSTEDSDPREVLEDCARARRPHWPDWRPSPPPSSALPTPKHLAASSSSRMRSHFDLALQKRPHQSLAPSATGRLSVEDACTEASAGDLPFDPRPATLPEVNRAWTRSSEGHRRLLEELERVFPHEVVCPPPPAAQDIVRQQCESPKRLLDADRV